MKQTDILKAVLYVLMICCSAQTAQAARSIGIVIGCSDYDDRVGIPTLDFVYNDASAVAYSLRNAKFTVKSVYARDEGDPNNLIPTKENVERVLRETLSEEWCGPDDTVLVYFSGHGTVSELDKEKTLLIVKDSILGREDSYIEAQKIRMILKQCPSKKVLFVVDSCHAGGTRSSMRSGADRFVAGGVEGVLTMASCTVDQKSKQWSSKAMSIFSYWLNEGLKGYADRDNDRAVSTHELFEYIHHHLELTETVRDHGQWPVIVSSEDTKHFDLVSPRARNLYNTLDDFAAQIVTQAEILQVDRLVVGDFRSVGSEWSNAREQNHIKSLSDYCIEELKRRIELKSAGKTLVISRSGEEGGAQACTLENSLIRQESETEGGRDVYILSSTLRVKKRGEPVCTIKSKVFADKTGENNAPPVQAQAAPGGATANASAYTSGNGSAYTTANASGNASAYASAYTSGNATANASANTTQIGAPGAMQHILPEVSILVRDPSGEFHKRMPIHVDGADWLPLEEGEVYRIDVQYPDPSIANPAAAYGVRILVDGRNTLPQYLPYVPDKFVIVEAAPNNRQEDQEQPGARPNANPIRANRADHAGNTSVSLPRPASDDLVFRPHVRLDKARFWIFHGTEQRQINGFYHSIGEDSQCDEFTVARSANTLAQNGQYTDQMGLITVAFYELTRTRGMVSDLMTVPGRTSPHSTFVMDGFEIGQILKFVQFRYASRQALDHYLTSPSQQTRFR